MKYFLAMALLLFSITVAAEESLIVPVIEVYDGDTVKTRLTLPNPLDVVSVRIYGIDTPEKPADSYPESGKLGRASCVKEAELGLKAKNAVEELVQKNPIMIVTNFKYGKYGGRIIGDAAISGIDVAQYLIERELAVPYDGGPKNHSWCD
jgi:endonuclease YncB( thermonuclease family)